MAARLNPEAIFEAIPRAKCEGATGLTVHEDYHYCGAQAQMLVLTSRGQRVYFLCLACGTNSVKNHDAVLLASNPEVVL